ncbi:glycine reductase [Clostridia bacterium]|nr:glycine reductase [Clostridia bacterium]
MNFPVIKGAAYSLFHTPEMVIHQGTTQTSEKRLNPDSEHLKALPKVLRSFQDVVEYPANQVYIGNKTPGELNEMATPWYDNQIKDASRDGKFGSIYTEDETLGLMKVVDIFDLVILEDSFQKKVAKKLMANPKFAKIKNVASIEKEGATEEEINAAIEKHGEALYFEGKIVGCVKRAHEFDQALTAHVMFENLAGKATSVATVMDLLDRLDINPEDIEYIVECSEEACGDMNQRGGGNIAKSIGEACNLINATGSDTRSFCAAPAHASVEAAALVQSGIYKNVLVVAGGCTAKLGMNSKSHIEKGVPVLEDVLGGFAFIVSENDGVSPIIRTDVIGRHTIGSGSSPQAVISAIVTDPLDRAGMSLKDIDKFAPEMQNPEITKPAGAGDVPEANYKMIAAIGVKRGEFDRKEIMDVVKSKGMPGFAPTQGHIPSGVPFLGFAKDMIESGEIERAMIIGKGSLFLGRLTNLFDGVSYLVEKNPGVVEEASSFDKEEVRKMVAESMRNFAASISLD